MQLQNLSQAHIRDSIAGEEDPGASLDVVRSMLKKEQQKATERTGGPSIHMDYRQGAKMIGVDVGWPRGTAGAAAAPKTAAELLELVVAYHGQIADTAWSWFHTTGKSQVELEVNEDAEGVFYVTLQDA